MEPLNIPNHRIENLRHNAPKGTKKAVAKGAAEGTDVPSNLVTLKGKVPSDGEARFIYAMLENITVKPDTNWDNVSEMLGLKDAKCAKERWRQIRLKYELTNMEDGLAATPTKAKGGRAKKTPAATLKTPAAAGDSIDELAVEDGTPAAKTPAAKGPRKRASQNDDNDAENSGTPKKRATPARKRATPAKKAAAAKDTTSHSTENADDEDNSAPAKKDESDEGSKMVIDTKLKPKTSPAPESLGSPLSDPPASPIDDAMDA
ncbi:hypothetical protein B0T17DRAFT_649896 [Bombardia bombarda]|uniref:Uncharacterized protein n=1 Tax=Bombardia bombarda TaxID=252184 RepID=A0AA40CDF7_9PEZI|nr:hypothetical protein B0T17DRAFT_649896 [Bombardia bombarda]